MIGIGLKVCELIFVGPLESIATSVFLIRDMCPIS